MSTAYDVLLQAARNLEAIVESKATATGTTTTLIDGTLTVYGFRDDDFNGGTIFISPALITVTDFAAATGTITFPARASATTAGQVYGIMHKRYPAYILRAKLNETLREIKIEAEVLTGSPPGYFPCSSGGGGRSF